MQSDWAGRAILGRWLSAGGNWIIYDQPDWSRYMMANESLRTETHSWLLEEALDLSARHGGSSFRESIALTRHAAMENGEGIIGYQYLHETNPSVGDFAIRGTVSGDRCHFDFDLAYTWNDMIDPNNRYASDAAKTLFAKIVTLGQATDYRIWITWHAKSSLYLYDTGTDVGWPLSAQK